MLALKCRKLKKSFGDYVVFDELSFSVPQHCVYGFLGVNGAGKTTTMKAIIGLMTLDSGLIEVEGKVIDNKQCNIGYLPDVPAFYGYMNALEYLEYCAGIAKMKKNEITLESIRLLKLVGLYDKRKNRISGYSRGMKQRLGIAQALINKPAILICDEPTSALDPIGRMEIINLLKDVSKETTVILSTHILDDIDKICDYIGILSEGKMAIEGNLETIKSQYAKDIVTVEVYSSIDLEKLHKLVMLEKKVNEIEISEDELIIKYHHDVSERNDNMELISKVIENKIQIKSFGIEKLKVEDIFRLVVK